MMMKSKITTILLLLFFTSAFSQDKLKEDIILNYDSEKVINKSNNLFKIDNEDFRYLKDKHGKKYILFKNISKKNN